MISEFSTKGSYIHPKMNGVNQIERLRITQQDKANITKATSKNGSWSWNGKRLQAKNKK